MPGPTPAMIASALAAIGRLGMVVWVLWSGVMRGRKEGAVSAERKIVEAATEVLYSDWWVD